MDDGESRSNGPFSGVVICVTGLSKDARKLVMDATERLGGVYSWQLHPRCTHLVAQSFHGHKFEHASRLGLSIVPLRCFLDSVTRNVRLTESLYKIPSTPDIRAPIYDFDHLLHQPTHHTNLFQGNTIRSTASLQSSTFYIDDQVSLPLKNKVIEALSAQGATLVGKWLLGSRATHVVCEGSSLCKYLGHSGTLVTPLWVLKTVKEKHLQRLIHLSADLARQTRTVLETFETGATKEDIKSTYVCDVPNAAMTERNDIRQKIANTAKDGVRQRRGRRMQSCRTPIRPITPPGLLDAICWSISEPTSTASIYTDSSSVKDSNEQHPSVLSDGNGEEKESEASFINMTRLLTESEKTELILKSHFLTILFPVDRFSEIGPSSRTYFSDNGFTCIQVLDYVFSFYQENMSTEEIEVAIHTDSRHADRLRSIYSGEETSKNGYIAFKRLDFLGSRRSFEMLKRVAGENSSNVYELLIRA